MKMSLGCGITRIKTFTHDTEYEDDSGAERTVRVSFTTYPGRAETLEEPAEDCTLDIIRVQRNEGSGFVDFDWFDIEAECNESIFDRWKQECWDSLDDREDNPS